MSGLEIYGATATAAGLVKVVIEVKKYFNKTAEELEALQQAKVAGIDQIASLRTVTKSIPLSFIKLNTDVLDLLSQEDKDSIKEIMKGMNKEIEKCEGTVSKLKAHTRKTLYTTSELEVLRGQLHQALSTLLYLQGALTGIIGMETLRRVSRGSAEHDRPQNPRSSMLEDISPPSRQDTVDSTRSMSTVTSAQSPESVSTIRSTSSKTLTNTSRSITLIESKQLRSAVDEGDSKYIERLIGQRATEDDQESWKASALHQACSFRRKSLVEILLSFNPNIHVFDQSGLGVMHATIGTSEQLSEPKEQAAADILQLLADYDLSLICSVDKDKRQPIHYCAMTGNYRAAQYILKVDRSRINATDSSKKTPLYHVCEHHSPNRRLVKLLLQNGGDFGTKRRPSMEKAKLKKVKKMLEDEEARRKLTLSS